MDAARRGRGGRGRRGGQGGRGRPKRTRDDSSYITLTNGRQIEYHPSFNFPPDVYSVMKQEDKDNLRNQRTEYKRQRQVQSMVTQHEPPQSQLPSEQPPVQIQTGSASQISQVSAGATTFMGGRNEQASQRQGQPRS